MLFNVSYQNTQHCKFAIFLSTVSNWGLSDPVEDFFLLSISGDSVLSAGLLTKSGTTQQFVHSVQETQEQKDQISCGCCRSVVRWLSRARDKTCWVPAPHSPCVQLSQTAHCQKTYWIKIFHTATLLITWELLCKSLHNTSEWIKKEKKKEMQTNKINAQKTSTSIATLTLKTGLIY